MASSGGHLVQCNLRCDVIFLFQMLLLCAKKLTLVAQMRYMVPCELATCVGAWPTKSFHSGGVIFSCSINILCFDVWFKIFVRFVLD